MYIHNKIIHVGDQRIGRTFSLYLLSIPWSIWYGTTIPCREYNQNKSRFGYAGCNLFYNQLAKTMKGWEYRASSLSLHILCDIGRSWTTMLSCAYLCMHSGNEHERLLWMAIIGLNSSWVCKCSRAAQILISNGRTAEVSAQGMCTQTIRLYLVTNWQLSCNFDV